VGSSATAGAGGAGAGSSGAATGAGSSGAAASGGTGAAASGTASGAGGSGASGGGGAVPVYPLVTPPVRAAAPAAFGGTGAIQTFASLGTGALLYASPPVSDGDASTAEGLSAADIASRFFNSGPTDIYFILGSIDSQIGTINTQLQNGAQPCLGQAAVPYTITPFGETVTLYAQCSQFVGSLTPADPGFLQFGQKDGVTYYYAAVGVEWVAAIVTPVGTTAGTSHDAGTDGGNGAESGAVDDGGSAVDDGGSAVDDATSTVDDGGSTGNDATITLDDGGIDADGAAANGGVAYTVHAWSSIGFTNATNCGDMSGFDDCSYGVIELSADPSTQTFEMSVAGIGFGYCGAQIKSDGSVVFGAGSIDMGTTCNATGTLCIEASDLSTPATCDASIMSFALPALGRVPSTGPNAGGPGVPHDAGAEWAPSAYPGGSADTIVLDGTSTDSLHFGPTAPSPGVTPL
jgi:hypothetical protein